jgi:ADP-heptose:LPS heptosyltransferase
MPQAEIHFLTKEKHEDLVRANPYITKVHLLGSNLSDMAQQLQKEGFDYVVDLHHNLRSQFIRQNIRKKTFTLQKLNVKKWLLVTMKINLMPKVHIVDRMMEAVAPLGIKNDMQGLDYFVPADETFEFEKLPEGFQNGYVALVLAGTYHTKRLPAEKHLELIAQADVPYVLLGGKSEIALAKQIEENTKGRVFNLCAQLSINQSALVIKQARLVVANDTGLMHIAAAFKKKILSVWGSTTPDLGMTPYLANGDSKIQQVAGLNCQPCSKIGRHQCPRKHFRCMLDQDTAEMAVWIKQNF